MYGSMILEMDVYSVAISSDAEYIAVGGKE